MAHTPRTAAQLGLIEQSLERFRLAEAHLSEALAAADPWVDQNRPRLEETRDRARSRLGRIELRGAIPGTKVAIFEGEPPTAVPPDGCIWTDPGISQVRVTIPGRAPSLKAVSVAAGATATIELSANTDNAPPPQASPPTPARSLRPSMTTPEPVSKDPVPAADSAAAKRLAGMMTATAGIALGITGVFTYLAGAEKLEAINSAAARRDVYDPSDGNWRTVAYGGATMIAAGAAIATTGAVLFLMNRKGTSPATSSAVANFGLAYHPNGTWLTTIRATF